MALTLTRLRAARRAQPQDAAPIAAANPLTLGLNSLYNAADGRFIRTRAGLQPFASSANSTRSTGAAGQALTLNGSSHWEQLPPGALSEGIHTRFALVRWGGTSRSTISAGITVNNALLWEIQTDGALVQVRTNAVETVHSPGGVVVAGEVCMLAMSWDGATSRLYKNGIQVSSAGYTGGFASGATPVIGKHYDNVFFFGGDIYLHADYGIALDPAAIRAISENPWQLFAPSSTQRTLWLPEAAGDNTPIAWVSASVNSSTAALSTSVRVASNSTTVNSSTANLATAVRLASNSATVNSSTAVLTTSVRVASNSTTVNASTAALVTAIRLSSNSVSQNSNSVTLAIGSALSFTSVSVNSSTANLTTKIAVASSATTTNSSTAALNTSVRVASSSATVNSSTAALTTAVRLAYVSQSANSDSVTLDGSAVSLSYASQSINSSTASLTTAVRVASSSSTVNSSTAALATAVRIATVSLAVNNSTASLATSVRLAVNSVSSNNSTAALTTQVRLSSTASAQNNTVTSLQTAVRLAYSSASVADSSVTLGATGAQLAYNSASKPSTAVSVATKIAMLTATYGKVSGVVNLEVAVMLRGVYPRVVRSTTGRRVVKS